MGRGTGCDGEGGGGRGAEGGWKAKGEWEPRRGHFEICMHYFHSERSSI